MANPPIIFNKLEDDQAHQVAKFHSDRGAGVAVTPDGSGTFTVRVNYPGVGTAAGQNTEASAENASSGSTWQRLAELYATYRGASDSLKVASLAQWALESNRGTSELSLQHLNFVGMKYRNRMRGFASPVTFTGADGEATAYCKFASLEAFVTGYWHFIQSGPYAGWERSSNDFSGFIDLIATNYSADLQYPQKVVALFAEARGLLGLPATVGQTSVKIPPQPAWTPLRARFLNKRTSGIQGIVLHDTAGAGTHNDTLYLNNPQDGREVSVDFTVEKDGSIWKLNPDLPSFYCNHAGRNTEWLGFKNWQVNAVSVGIEIVQSDKLQGPHYYPVAQIKAVAALCAWLGVQFQFNNSRITTHRQVITDGSRSDPRMFPFDDFWAAYWSVFGRGESFQRALAGQAVGYDAASGNFSSSTEVS